MAFFKQVIFVTAVLGIMLFSPAIAHKANSRPAPPVHHVDHANLLTAYSTFRTFFGYLQKTNVIQTIQQQANNTKVGITMFVPKDSAFAALKKTTLARLTGDKQLKSLLLYHALPRFYDLHALAMLGRRNPVATFAGSQYTLNLTEHYGNILVRSTWSTAKIGSSAYEVDKVLLPKQIFKRQPKLKADRDAKA